MDDISDIKNYYDSAVEQNRSQTHQLEFVMTEMILKKLIHETQARRRGKIKVLELGAGNGHFTEILARAQCEVSAIELSPVLFNLNQKNIKSQGLLGDVQLICGDARNVLKLVSGSFDLILVMGPLYHLVEHADRLQLLKDVGSLLAPEGIVASSFLNRAGLISYMLYKYPQWIQSPVREAQHLWASGENVDHPRSGVFRGYFVTQEQIRSLHQEAGLKLIAMHSQDPMIGGIDEVFNRLPDELKQQWAEFLFEISTDPEVLGSGRTLMSIARG